MSGHVAREMLLGETVMRGNRNVKRGVHGVTFSACALVAKSTPSHGRLGTRVNVWQSWRRSGMWREA